MLTKFNYLPKIHLNQSTNCLSTEEKKRVLNMEKNQKSLLIIHIY